MIHSKKFYMRIRSIGIGPGGWKCACCAPAPGKVRKQWVRMKKKQERRLFAKLLADLLD